MRERNGWFYDWLDRSGMVFFPVFMTVLMSCILLLSGIGIQEAILVFMFSMMPWISLGIFALSDVGSIPDDPDVTAMDDAPDDKFVE